MFQCPEAFMSPEQYPPQMQSPRDQSDNRSLFTILFQWVYCERGEAILLRVRGEGGAGRLWGGGEGGPSCVNPRSVYPVPTAGERGACWFSSALRMSDSWPAENRSEAPGMSHHVATRGVPRSTWHSTTWEGSSPRFVAMAAPTSAMGRPRLPRVRSAGSWSWSSTGECTGAGREGA